MVAIFGGAVIDVACVESESRQRRLCLWIMILSALMQLAAAGANLFCRRRQT